MSFKSTPHRITAQIRDFRPFQGSRPAFIRTVVIFHSESNMGNSTKLAARGAGGTDHRDVIGWESTPIRGAVMPQVLSR
jgi:hypothetical protein